MTMSLVLGPESLEPRPPSMVERMTLIMDCFEGSNSLLLLEEVTRRTGLPRSTVHRILDQLVRLEWVEHTRNGYRLGRRVVNWGVREAGHLDLRAAAAPLLHEMAVTTGLVAHLAVLDGASIEYLDKIGGRGAAGVASRVGGRAPAHCTALGKAMLAWMTPEEIDSLYRDGMSAPTPSSITEIEVLHRELSRIRRFAGVAYERSECIIGVGCVASAVRGPDRPIGAISLVGPDGVDLQRVAPLVCSAAVRVSRAVLGSGSARQDIATSMSAVG